jgi:hypothetical protein
LQHGVHAFSSTHMTEANLLAELQFQMLRQLSRFTDAKESANDVERAIALSMANYSAYKIKC